MINHVINIISKLQNTIFIIINLNKYIYFLNLINQKQVNKY